MLWKIIGSHLSKLQNSRPCHAGMSSTWLSFPDGPAFTAPCVGNYSSAENKARDIVLLHHGLLTH